MIAKSVQNMPLEVQECLRLYAHVVDQFAKEVRDSSENGNT